MTCFIEIPIDQLLVDRNVIISGKIESITYPTKSDIASANRGEDSKHIDDIAQLTVNQVYKNDLLNAGFKIEEGSKIPLKMPSIHNSIQMSTDIKYKKGAEGIWLLTFHDGYFYASYPKDFQPPEFVEVLKKNQDY